MASQLESPPYLNHPAPSPSSHSPSPSSSSSRRHHSHSHNNGPTTPDTTPSPSSSSTRRHHHHHHHSSHRSSSSSSSNSTRPRSSSVTSERSSRRHSSNKHSHSHNQQGHPTYHAHHPRPGGLLPTSSTSAKTTPMHDDTDAGRLIPVNPPAAAIDYLGNGWNNEDDIAESWKFMTKQKNDLINGLRLENASWRNWAKQRHNLKTISPKSLNWLKDSDTTWLYGPLYKAAIDEFDRSRFGAQTVAVAGGGSVSAPHEILPTDLASVISPSTPTTTSSAPTTPPASLTSGIGGARGYGLKSGGPLKPVLKHKTASELFKADTLFHVQSDLRLSRKIEPINKARESAVFKQHRQPKLRFNDSVEQCVSIDTDVISEEDEEMLADDDMGGDSSSKSNRHENENEDEEARAGLNGRHEDEDSGLLMRISAARRPPRSIVRIDSTTLKAASLHGMQDEDLEDPEDATTTDDEEEEGLFDEPIYLGNPYTGSGTAYVGSRQDAPHEAALDDVSYTRPSPPSPSAGSTASADSSTSSTTVFYSAPSTPIDTGSSIEEQLPVKERQQAPAQPQAAPPVQSSQPSQQQQQQQQTGTYVVTHTSSPRTISTSFLEQPLPVYTTTSTTPVPSAARTALTSALEAEKAMAANGGMQQRATDLVANVKGLVNWASSLVFNSSTF